MGSYIESVQPIMTNILLLMFSLLYCFPAVSSQTLCGPADCDLSCGDHEKCSKDVDDECQAEDSEGNNTTEVSEACCQSFYCRKACKCTRMFSPVCGADGRTHPNECVATCLVGTTVACEGGCPCLQIDDRVVPVEERCMCPRMHMPVCGMDGRDYNNPCLASCARTQVACPDKCPCDDQEPDRDSRLYSFRFYDQQLQSTTPDLCSSCPNRTRPVCGQDGLTYTNRCRAKCAGVRVRHFGPCRLTVQEDEK